MKFHRHLVSQIVLALEQIFEQGFYADKVIEKMFKAHPKWGGRDRRYFAETVYELTRWYRYYEALAVEKNYWKIWGAYSLMQGHELPDWNELQGLRLSEVKTKAEQIKNPAILQSIPDWLFEKGQAELGAQWLPNLQVLNKPAEAFLRVNTLKASLGQVLEDLQNEDIGTTPVGPVAPHALRLNERKNVHATKTFHKGFFEMQDVASQLVAPLLAPKAGDRVADACAGGGGKSLHLAALMANKGKIISMDIHEWKLKELKNRARRAGVDIIETRVIENSKTIKRLEKSFDKVLLDVPCSGMGVLRRNPDSKWKLKPEEFERLRELQRQILQDYSQMTKNGGSLVYATCSLFPSENQEQVQNFLSSNTDWTLVEEKIILPAVHGFDGFYAALLSRNK